MLRYLSLQERTSEDSKEAESFQQLLTARIQEFVEEVCQHLIIIFAYIAHSHRLLMTTIKTDLVSIVVLVFFVLPHFLKSFDVLVGSPTFSSGIVLLISTLLVSITVTFLVIR